MYFHNSAITGFTYDQNTDIFAESSYELRLRNEREQHEMYISLCCTVVFLYILNKNKEKISYLNSCKL
jgi:hypothetical protein